MPAEMYEGNESRRLWLEIRSLRVSFDDALSSALEFAPEPRSTAIDDVARRAERIMVAIHARVGASAGLEITEAIRLLELHIAERLLLARRSRAVRDAAVDRPL